MPTQQELEDFGQYLNGYSIVKNVLVAERDYLETIWHGIGGTLSEKAAARAASAYIEKELLIVENAYVTVLNKFQSGINPPTTTQVKKAYELAEEIAKVVRANSITNEILAQVAKDVAVWASI